MKEVPSTIYMAEDGKTFVDASECARYEADLEHKRRHTHYFEVGSCQDLTEGRGFQVITAYMVTDISEDLAQLALTEYVAKTCKMIDYVQGVDPVRGFYVQKRSADWWASKDQTFPSRVTRREKCLKFVPPLGLVDAT